MARQQNNLPGIYNATPIVLADGEGSALATDINGKLTASFTSAAPTPTAANAYTWVYKSAALEHKGIARAQPALFAQAFGSIDETETSDVFYIQFYNSATVPADGAVPTLILEDAIPHTSGITTTFNVDASIGRVFFSTGISWALSSTQFTKTEIASNKAAITVLGY